MKVTYNGPVAEVFLDTTGQTARVGDTIEVPDAVGVRLVEQGWTATGGPITEPPADTDTDTDTDTGDGDAEDASPDTGNDTDPAGAEDAPADTQEN